MTIRWTEIAPNVFAFLMVAVVAYVWECPIRCALQADASWVGLLAVLVGAFAAAIHLNWKWVSPGVLLAALATVLIIGASGRLPADCCSECFAGDGDLPAVAATLIGGEEALVMGPNLGMIEDIFHAQATVTNASTRAIEEVHAHYKNLTAGLQFLALSHETPTLVGSMGPNRFEVSTQSFGKFQPRSSNQVTTFQGLDLWTITRRHRCACWKIQAFTFNVNR